MLGMAMSRGQPVLGRGRRWGESWMRGAQQGIGSAAIDAGVMRRGFSTGVVEKEKERRRQAKAIIIRRSIPVANLGLVRRQS